MSAHFQSGFVTLMGLPNAGKSTLLNSLVGANISVSTPKAHTTREKTLGIMNTIGFQIVFCDTPGLLNPKHALQKHMETQLRQSLEGPDAVLFLVGLDEKPSDLHRRYFDLVDKELLLLALNKSDCCEPEEIGAHQLKWQNFFGGMEVHPISAHTGDGIADFFPKLLDRMPIHPPYYPADQITDKSERFIAAEILRKHILLGYKAEIPYSTCVSVCFFKEMDEILHIHADIHTEKDSQKAILIGKKGHALRGVGTRARYEMQRFFGKKVFLRTQVYVVKAWKSDHKQVKRLSIQ